MKSTEKEISIHRLLLVSGIAGALGTLCKTISSATFYFTGISKSMGPIESGAIVFHTVNFPKTAGYLLLGTFVHIIWGAMLAIGLGLIYFLVGKKYYVLQGMFYGFIVWVIFRSFLISLSVPTGMPPSNLATTLVSLLGHLIYGAVTAVILTKVFPFREEVKILAYGEADSKKRFYMPKNPFRLIPVPARKPEKEKGFIKPIKPKKL